MRPPEPISVASHPGSDKQAVRAFWQATPCGTRELREEPGTRAYFDRLERERDRLEPFIGAFARFAERRGQRVLEVGVGAATDFVRFARAGARLTGVDLTPRAVELARQRLALEGLEADVREADAEALPFEDGSFDFVYSWGVVHHTPRTERAVAEILRVVRPGGRVCVMVYHRRSLVALQAWLLYALLRGRPWMRVSEVLARHVESPGTRAFTRRETRELFAGFDDLVITPVVTAYDLRLSRRLRLPLRWGRLLPPALGWFLVVTARRPEDAGGS